MAYAIVSTKPTVEFEAENALRRRGFRTVLPTFRRRLRNGRLEMRAVFANYLFVQLDRGEAWLAIILAPHVCGIVRKMGERDLPAMLPDDLVDAVRVAAEAGDFDDIAQGVAVTGRAAGDRVQIGPHAKFIAELKEVDARGRSRALVGLFNRETVATIGAATSLAVASD